MQVSRLNNDVCEQKSNNKRTRGTKKCRNIFFFSCSFNDKIVFLKPSFCLSLFVSFSFAIVHASDFANFMQTIHFAPRNILIFNKNALFFPFNVCLMCSTVCLLSSQIHQNIAGRIIDVLAKYLVLCCYPS